MAVARTVLLTLLAISPLAPARAQGIRWFINIDEAKQEAYLRQKLILLFFEYSSFDRSANMVSDVWHQDSVIAVADRFVCMRVDFQQLETSANIGLRDKDEKLITRYRVTSVPVVFVIDPAGNPLVNFNDELPLTEIIKLLQSLPGDLQDLFRILRALEKDNDNVGLKIAAGDEYQRLQVSHLSNMFYLDVEDEDTLKQDPALAEHVRAAEAVNFERLGESETAIGLFERLLDENPNSAQRPYHLYMLAKLYHDRLRTGRAREYYDMLKKEYPQSEYTFKTWELLKE